MANALNYSTIDTLRAFERAPSVLKVKEAFRQFAEGHGYTAFLCTDPPRADYHETGSILFDEWPHEWRRRYLQRKYVYRDPMVAELSQTMQPFTWLEVRERRKFLPSEWAIVDEASEWGMHTGFVVPLLITGGRVHAITMAGYKPRTDLQARAELHLVSIYAHARAKCLTRGVPEVVLNLTARERQVLQFVSLGKSDSEIGIILKITPSAVHKHVENIKRRLNVGTRMQAVVTAIRQGQISV